VLTAILSLLSSNVAGSLIGWIGGWLNKREDRALMKLQLEDKVNQRTHELALKNVDILIMEKELAGKERIAVIEQETQETKQAYDLLAQSYEHDSTLKGSAAVESFRAIIRPFLAGWFTLIACLQTGVIIYLGFVLYKINFSNEQMFELVKYSIMWVFFQAGVCIGWYFANRSSSAPPKLPKI
jgi:hypothetical protein